MSNIASQTLLLILFGKATVVLDEKEPTCGLGAKAYIIVFPDGGRGTAVGHLLSGRATAHIRHVLLGSPLRLAVDQKPAAW